MVFQNLWRWIANESSKFHKLELREWCFIAVLRSSRLSSKIKVHSSFILLSFHNGDFRNFSFLGLFRFMRLLSRNFNGFIDDASASTNQISKHIELRKVNFSNLSLFDRLDWKIILHKVFICVTVSTVSHYTCKISILNLINHFEFGLN